MIDITKTYRTRDGREVTSLSLSGGTESYPIWGTVAGVEYPYAYSPTGGYWADGTETNHDLILVEDLPAPAAPSIDSEVNRQARSEALGHAVRLSGARSAAHIVKDAEAFYGFLTGAAAA